MQALEQRPESNRMLTVLAFYVCTFYPLTDFGINTTIGLTFLLVYWLYNVLTKKGNIYLTRSRIGYSCIACIVLLYYLLPNARQTKSTLALVLSMLICTLYLLSATISKEDIISMMKIFVIFSFLFSLYIVFCKLFPNIYLRVIVPKLRKTTTAEESLTLESGYGVHIANSITYGPYIISMGFFYCFADLLLGTGIIRRKCSIIYEILFLIAILCEGRRSELISLAATSLFVYIFINNNHKDLKAFFRKWGKLIPIISISVVIVIILLNKGYLGRFVDTLDLLQDGLNTDNLNRLTSSRYRLWENAWNLFKSSPVFGIGWGSFSLHVVTRVNNVHNCYLQFLCETGLWGFFVIIIPMIALLIRTLKYVRRIIENQKGSKNFTGNAILLSTGMQIFFLILYAMDPVFYKGYYHMLHIILAVYSEYAIQIFEIKSTESEDMGDAKSAQYGK